MGTAPTDDPRAGVEAGIPLCVDLDGTLCASDTLLETLLRVAVRRPLALPRLAVGMMRGRAELKRRAAEAVAVDPAGLVYREDVLELIASARSGGRRVLLVTAADAATAEAIAAHIGVFDEVIGSDGSTNLKGAAKRDLLVARFGERGFDYAGDSRADLPIFAVARKALLVAPSRGLRASAESVAGGRLALVGRRAAKGPALLRALRVHQWSKNMLVMAPALLVHDLPRPGQWLGALLALAAFSLCASAGYVLNDLADLPADRRHPTKRHRPFASGTLDLVWGPPLFLVLLVAGFALAALTGRTGFVVVLAFYFLLSIFYSFILKRLAIVDVIVLAGLYTLRILAGGVATGIEISAWLLAFSSFLFFSLALAKRYVELLSIEGPGDARIRRRGYVKDDREMVASMGPTAGYVAVLVFALYLSGDRVRMNYDSPIVLWLVLPVLLYWITRVWFLARRGELADDPVRFALGDSQSWFCALLIVVIAAAARFLSGAASLPLVF